MNARAAKLLILGVIFCATCAHSTELVLQRWVSISRSLDGQVLVSGTDEPISGATVELCSSGWKKVIASAKTDDKGKLFYLRVSAPGMNTYQLRVRINKYAEQGHHSDQHLSNRFPRGLKFGPDSRLYVAESGLREVQQQSGDGKPPRYEKICLVQSRITDHFYGDSTVTEAARCWAKRPGRNCNARHYDRVCRCPRINQPRNPLRCNSTCQVKEHTSVSPFL